MPAGKKQSFKNQIAPISIFVLFFQLTIELLKQIL